MERRKAGLRDRRGQSIVEYLVLIGAFVLALTAIRTMVDTKMGALSTSALGKVDTAKATVATVNATRN